MKKKRLFVATIVGLVCSLVFSACDTVIQLQTVSILSIEKTASEGLIDTYTIYYSDGSEYSFEVTNGADGEKGEKGETGAVGDKGEKGDKGDDGEDVTVEALYEAYVTEHGDVAYEDFLALYMTLQTDNFTTINRCLQSAVKIYSEFREPNEEKGNVIAPTAYTGAGVVYKIDDDYTYFLTNYHVVHSADATDGEISKKMHLYLYGSESKPTAHRDANDVITEITYDEYAIPCEYIGGAITCDVAVVRAETAKVKQINENIAEIKFAEDYYVGQTAFTIGNPLGGGISATEGIVSVKDDYIELAIDETVRTYRSVRMDTALYGGNSGGGLFNASGELIGLSNAGRKDVENINFAVPLPIVKGVAYNVMKHYCDGNAETLGVYKPTLGLSVEARNSKYVYDADKGYGKIVEEMLVSEIAPYSIASRVELQVGDRVKWLQIDGVNYVLDRNFHISDALFYATAGSEIAFIYERNGVERTSNTYTIKASDLTLVE